MGRSEGRRVANVVIPTADYTRFATHYRFRPDFCEGGDPESKGVGEHLVGYDKRDLMVAAERSLADLAAVNAPAALGTGCSIHRPGSVPPLLSKIAEALEPHRARRESAPVLRAPHRVPVGRPCSGARQGLAHRRTRARSVQAALEVRRAPLTPRDTSPWLPARLLKPGRQGTVESPTYSVLTRRFADAPRLASVLSSSKMSIVENGAPFGSFL
jgi:hypothetical protein